MITVLGIGGTFQIGFQISTITYMSQVGKDAHMAHCLTVALSLHSCLRMLLSGIWKRFNYTILPSLFFPITMLSCKAEHVKALKIEEKRENIKLLIELFLRRCTLSGVSSASL